MAADPYQQQQSLQAERANLDASWALLRREKEAIEAFAKESGVEVKLFVGNLDTATTAEELETLFSPYGFLKQVVILKDKQGNSKRSAFVMYYNPVAADAAMDALHEKHTDKESSRPMVVKMATAKPQQPAYAPQYAAAPSPYAQQGYDGYPGYAPAAQAPQAYNPYGGYGAPAPPQTRGGYGPVETRGPPTPRGPPDANLYVTNLPRGANEEGLRSMFASFGTIVSVRAFEQGYGFVGFSSAAEAQAAISRMNGTPTMEGKTLEVSIKTVSSKKKTSRFNPY
jgi:RNA recognition motif-containing protein